MSRISPEQDKPVNPAKHFFEWSGKDGELTYYDKEKTRPDVEQIEKEIASLEASLSTTPEVARKAVSDIINDLKKKKISHNIPVKTPFTFIALDRMITLGGYNKAAAVGYYANEIKKDDLKTAIFRVRSKNGLEAEGTYESIKGNLSGLKYTEVVYVAFIEDKELYIGAIKMTGSSLTSWFDYVNGAFDSKTKKRISNANNPYKGAVVMSKGAEMINGETRYFPPSFTPKEIKAETETKALQLTAELAEFHKAYFAYEFKSSVEKNAATSDSTPTAEEVEATFKTETPATDALFNNPKSESAAIVAEEDDEWS